MQHMIQPSEGFCHVSVTHSKQRLTETTYCDIVVMSQTQRNKSRSMSAIHRFLDFFHFLSMLLENLKMVLKKYIKQ